MFRNDRLVKPKMSSLVGTGVVAVAAFFGSRASPFVGYLVALLALIVMIVAMFMSSIWPTRGRAENPAVFALFWGLMIGAILPFLVSVLLEDGFQGLVELLSS